jgi:hypothetical protein
MAPINYGALQCDISRQAPWGPAIHNFTFNYLLGTSVGVLDGAPVGNSVGVRVGALDGDGGAVGLYVGVRVGEYVGYSEGVFVRPPVANLNTGPVGYSVGVLVGVELGPNVYSFHRSNRISFGTFVGACVGRRVGCLVGCRVGYAVLVGKTVFGYVGAAV